MTEIIDLDDVYGALKRLVDDLGGAKRVGPRLRPEHDRARDWLLNCLNPEHSQKLDPEQVFLLLRWGCEAGVHTARHYLDQLTGYAPSTPASIEVQFITALKEARDAEQRANRRAADLQELVHRPELLALMRAANLKVDP